MFIFAYCISLWAFGAFPVNSLGELIWMLCFGGMVFIFQIEFDRAGEEMRRNKR